MKIVLFDADGVLLHGEIFSAQLERERGIQRTVVSEFFRVSFKDCLLGTGDLKTAIAPYLEKWGWTEGVDAFLDYWFLAEHVIDEQLISYVQDLRKSGISCRVATNQEKYRAQYMLEKMGFDRSFDKLYVSAHLGHKKPSEEFFRAIIADNPGISTDTILFWDDSPENVAAAKKCGLRGEVYTTFADFTEKMKRYLR